MTQSTDTMVRCLMMSYSERRGMQPADNSAALPVVQDDWIGTACYFCYGQCVNFGVEGKTSAEGVQIRPCSRGFSKTVERRKRRENRLRRVDPTALPRAADASGTDHP